MDLPTFTPRDLLGLLAEEDRLRVVAAIVLGARAPHRQLSRVPFALVVA